MPVPTVLKIMITYISYLNHNSASLFKYLFIWGKAMPSPPKINMDYIIHYSVRYNIYSIVKYVKIC